MNFKKYLSAVIFFSVVSVSSLVFAEEVKVKVKEEAVVAPVEKEVLVSAEKIEVVEKKVEVKEEAVVAPVEKEVLVSAEKIEVVEKKVEVKEEAVVAPVEKKVLVPVEKIEVVEKKVEVKEEAVVAPVEKEVLVSAEKIEVVEKKVEVKKETVVAPVEKEVLVPAEKIEVVEKKVEKELTVVPVVKKKLTIKDGGNFVVLEEKKASMEDIKQSQKEENKTFSCCFKELQAKTNDLTSTWFRGNPDTIDFNVLRRALSALVVQLGSLSDKVDSKIENEAISKLFAHIQNLYQYLFEKLSNGKSFKKAKLYKKIDDLEFKGKKSLKANVQEKDDAQLTEVILEKEIKKAEGDKVKSLKILKGLLTKPKKDKKLSQMTAKKEVNKESLKEALQS